MNNYPSGADCPAWKQLAGAAPAARTRTTRELFAADDERFAHCSVEAAGLLFDYSRQRVSAELLPVFAQLADQLQLRERIAAMFRGDTVNTTEVRAVLHTALRRGGAPAPLLVAGQDIDALVRAERERMLAFAEGVRSGAVYSSSDQPFSLVINIGIGGSDLGPAMAVEALRQYTAGGPRVACVSNVDGCQLADLLALADPARTLFIICSKTFTTLETRTNALAARAWLRARLGAAAVPAHFAAVSVNARAMDEFGVHPEYRFAMWDWVGGRYSIWSSIGVSLAIAIGRAHFEAFLHGAAAMDRHFQEAPWLQNLPVLAAMLGIWNINFLDLPTLAILPYDQRLARFSAYLQQLEMESNGKSVRLDGSPAPVPTCPVIWGEPGNNAQHSFFQLLHQGSPRAALDFLLPVISSCDSQPAQDLAIANCLAQAEAFAFGQGAAAVAADLHRQGMAPERVAELLPHKVHAGNRPSTLLMFPRVDPPTLGKLIALYEHKVLVQSVVWGINAFDQWGVELGKRLCDTIVPLVKQPRLARELSSSLRGALKFVERERR
ncbi:MAG: glucose-6-phosphate isomerase [Gammaproteobacteria bacterium]|nr:glucose-6-phosphate isomerase [Gammaproteobacteria bacterium]